MTTSTWVGRERSWLSEQVVSGLMRISDCVVIAMAAGLAYLHGPVSMSWSAAPLLLIIAVLLMPQAASLFGVYSASPRQHPMDRSEEHTSELQSLMRISYAVFCLKKKKNHN